MCVSHTKRVGENITVLQLKQFTEVLLTGLTLKKLKNKNKNKRSKEKQVQREGGSTHRKVGWGCAARLPTKI